MADAYEMTPSTGRHRGGPVNVKVTTSVRAQEPVDPSSYQRRGSSPTPTAASAAGKTPPGIKAEPRDEAVKGRSGTKETSGPMGSPATAGPQAGESRPAESGGKGKRG